MEGGEVADPHPSLCRVPSSLEHFHGHYRARFRGAAVPRVDWQPRQFASTACSPILSCPTPSHLLYSQEYDYPSSQDGSKDPSGAGAMWSPSWWNGGSDSGGECGMPTARRFRTPVSNACIAAK